MASDHGSPPLIGSATVCDYYSTVNTHTLSLSHTHTQIVINVLDVNDNTPLFENGRNNISSSKFATITLPSCLLGDG